MPFTVLVDRNALGVQANGGVPDVAPAISGDGMQVAFVSFATNLVAANTNGVSDVYSDVESSFSSDGCPEWLCPDGQVCVKASALPTTATVPPSRTPTPTITGRRLDGDPDGHLPPVYRRQPVSSGRALPRR